MRFINKLSTVVYNLILLWVAIIVFTGTSFASEPADNKGWFLLWQDEFNGKTLDPAKWRVEDAALVKNNELEYYSPEEVYLENGSLVLRSEEKPTGGRPYTSGLVETKGKFAFQYGKVEVRAQLPAGKGLWPAHWLLPVNGKWPPELDIMELLGHQPNVIYMSVHTGDWPEHKNRGKMYIGPDFSAGFHIFTMEWDKDYVRWFVDGEQKAEVRDDIPQEPFYLILNTAVGGSWPGNPNSRTVFPQYHKIDYVRVYAREIPGTYFLLTHAEEGKIKIDPERMRFEENSAVKLTAIPRLGYKFNGFSGDVTSQKNPLTLKMTANMDITANFIKDPNAPKLLSRGKKATASSWEGAGFEAANISDGNPGTRWSSEFSDPQWAGIDLGRVCRIEAVRLSWENAFGREYELQVSRNGKKWKTIYHRKNGKGGTEEITGLKAKGRYIRLYGIKRAREWGYSLWEMEVFGGK